jgi:cytochrome c oxidase assembly factor CtaG
MTFAEADRLFGPSSCFSGVTIAGWTTDFSVTAPLLLSLVIYLIGVGRLWHSAGIGRGASPLQVAAFVLGWSLMAIALISPLHDWSRRLFTAHMIGHELVMTLAAPLLVLSRPLGPLLWAFPRTARAKIARGTQVVAYLLFWEILTLPLVAAALHAAAIWVWHMPVLYEAALRIEWVHWAQHLSFTITALLFWWSVLDGPARGRVRASGIFLLFATGLHTACLGVLISLARQPLYGLQSRAAAEWNLTPLSDQQLAGLVMWVPGGMVYAVAALALAALWIRRSSGPARSPAMLRQARHAE